MAWPVLNLGLSAAVAVSEEQTIDEGATHELGLDEASVVVLISTEGAEANPLPHNS